VAAADVVVMATQTLAVNDYKAQHFTAITEHSTPLGH